MFQTMTKFLHCLACYLTAMRELCNRFALGGVYDAKVRILNDLSKSAFDIEGCAILLFFVVFLLLLIFVLLLILFFFFYLVIIILHVGW